MSKNLPHVDLTPINEFRYIQIPNYDFTFILLDQNLKAVHSAFQCKDYLQDIFYTEYTGKAAEIWGIEWSQGMLEMDVEYFKMALHGGNIPLRSQAKRLQNFLNQFEASLQIPFTKVSPTDNPLIILVEFSKAWTENGPLLSAFTTLIRLGGMYHSGSPVKYLKKIHEYKHPNKQPKGFKQYMFVDISRMDNSLPKLAALLQGKKPVHNWSDFRNINWVHDTGIVGFRDFPTVKV